MSKSPAMPIMATLIGHRTFRLILDATNTLVLEVTEEQAIHLAEQTIDLESEVSRGIFEKKEYRAFRFEGFDPGPLPEKTVNIDRRTRDQIGADEDAVNPAIEPDLGLLPEAT